MACRRITNLQAFLDTSENASTVARAVTLNAALNALYQRRNGEAIDKVLGCRSVDYDAFCRQSAAPESRTGRDILDQLETLAVRLKQQGRNKALLREKIEAYIALFQMQPDVPESKVDAYFSDFVRALDAVLDNGVSDELAFIFQDSNLNFSEYYYGKMKEYNNTAERLARNDAAARKPLPDRKIDHALRKAIEFGNKACTIISRNSSPFMVTIKLYSGFEKRVQDNFLIEDHILTSISSDGQVAAVRIDRRFDTLRRVLSELCRSYTRLGAFEKAKQCEWYVRNIPIGYRAKKTYDMVAFEEESWQSIVAVG